MIEEKTGFKIANCLYACQTYLNGGPGRLSFFRHPSWSWEWACTTSQQKLLRLEWEGHFWSIAKFLFLLSSRAFLPAIQNQFVELRWRASHCLVLNWTVVFLRGLSSVWYWYVWGHTGRVESHQQGYPWAVPQNTGISGILGQYEWPPHKSIYSGPAVLPLFCINPNVFTEGCLILSHCLPSCLFPRNTADLSQHRHIVNSPIARLHTTFINYYWADPHLSHTWNLLGYHWSP